MRGTSRVRLMAELGWEEMKLRRAIHELICYFKIVKKKRYKRSFFPSTTKMCNDIGLGIHLALLRER